MKTIAVIPARFASTRFPGKPLAQIAGRPMIAHVIDRALEARSVDEALVATDDERILEAAKACGVRAFMTSPEHPSGTDRIAEVVRLIPDAEYIVNLQGDEPLMPPSVVDLAVEALKADPDCAVSTAMIRIAREADHLSPHVVKVVCDCRGRALYFSRSPLPSLVRAGKPDLAELEADGRPFFGFKHFGLYVYRRAPLLEFVRLQPSPLERIEKLEQLRFLENGMPIRVVEATVDSVGVDTPEDLERVRPILEERLRAANKTV
jgi:3-deoxy-manno-octulosonate cytidylyltransferase (CMP-KDO synthetase)